MYAPTTAGDDIPNTRKYGSVDEDTAKFTIIVPEHVGGQNYACRPRAKAAESARWSATGSSKSCMKRNLSDEVLRSSLKGVFRNTGHGDLTIAWNEDKHDAMVGHIQAPMDRGVVFHKLVEQGKDGRTPDRRDRRDPGSQSC